jgi:CubicO group peptidase (beta-lactamase class C family)
MTEREPRRAQRDRSPRPGARGAPPGWLALLCFIVACTLSRAQTSSRAESLPVSADLDAKLEEIRAKHGVPALAAAATTGDRLLAIGAAGVRKLGSPEKATVADRWHLGSCTKSMTATMLARLVERGTLKWDTTIGEAFKGDLEVPEVFAPVTIEQMLAHRSGIPSDLSRNGLWGKLWEKKGTPTEQRRQLVEGVFVQGPATRPGTDYLYSNAGFAFAGYIAERATKKPWEDLMRDELFTPLGMSSAGFGAPGTKDAVTQPWGHRNGDDPVAPGPNADNPPAIGPAGTAHASLADWAKYAAVHLRGARGKTGYLEPETFARLQSKPPVGDYSFGWGHHERPWANGHVLSHAGSNNSWYCVVWLAPNRGAAFLACTNVGGNAAAAATDQAIGAVMRAVQDAIEPQKR